MSPWFLRRIVQCSLATAPLHLCSLVRGKYRLITRERERGETLAFRLPKVCKPISLASRCLPATIGDSAIISRVVSRSRSHARRDAGNTKTGRALPVARLCPTTVTRWHCSLRVPANARKNSERRSITSTQETYDSRRRRFLCASTKRNMYVCSTNTSRVLLARSNSIGSRICLAGRDRLSVR